MSKYDTSIDEILNIEWRNIKTLMTTLNRSVTEEIIDLLLTVKPKNHKVITAGCGTSGILARRVAHSLCVVEIPAFYCSVSNSIHGGMGAIQKDDIVVLFSKGGNTEEILNYLPVCKKKGAKVIGVSQNDDSALAQNADIYFKVQVDYEADQWNMCASASCNAIAAVWDALIFTAMKYNGYTKEDLLLTHSGGKVKQIAGIVTQEGGPTGHTAILARMLDIPAVVGVKGAMDEISQGDVILLDGEEGCVLISPQQEEISAFEIRGQEMFREQAENERFRGAWIQRNSYGSTMQDYLDATALMDKGLVDVGYSMENKEFPLSQFEDALKFAAEPGRYRVTVNLLEE